jgi:uncharacterized protein YqjF (DUF2071 family)
MSAASSPPRILQATARNRVVVTYAVAPEQVAPLLPTGLVPDTHDGQAYVTLVGVELVKVRVLGLAGPGFRRVPAVELQVLVREDGSGSDRAGTITMQAYVPRRLVAWGARGLYGEPVDVASMQPLWRERAGAIEMTYRFDRAGREQRLRAVGQKPPVMPAPDTLAVFLMDRGWRFGTSRGGALRRSRIERPVEPLYRVQERYVTVRWEAVYGSEWAFLEGVEPTLVMLSPGGPVTLHWRELVA